MKTLEILIKITKQTVDNLRRELLIYRNKRGISVPSVKMHSAARMPCRDRSTR
jgi:hypothetical protein